MYDRILQEKLKTLEKYFSLQIGIWGHLFFYISTLVILILSEYLSPVL